MASDPKARELAATEYYFVRFGFAAPAVAEPPNADLGLVVVVPCYNEPDLIGALESLWNCEWPECAVEVIAVINGPAEANQEVRRQNEATFEQAIQWGRGHHEDRVRFYPVYFPDLPPRHAGVGLARKVGMDEALRRLTIAGRAHDGVIVGYDADCRCECNYLRSIEAHFRKNPKTPAASVYFEHPLAGPLPLAIYSAITEYEVHLRYFVNALRWARFPHAFHTIGSCMAVRAAVYRDQGGMNRRKAGEDFYFLHKIIPLGGFTEINDTAIYPSPRESDRVPFGTGKAMQTALAGSPLRSYPLEAFQDLGEMFQRVPTWFADPPSEPPKDLSAPLREFLVLQNFSRAIQEMREHTTSRGAFQKRFFRWFDGFRVLKCIHFLRDTTYGPRPVLEEASRLLKLLLEPREENLLNTAAMLMVYRELDHSGALRPRSAGGMENG